MSTTAVFEHLKKHGQVRDADIASALGLGINKVRTSLSTLSERGEIACCQVTRYHNGKPVDEILCRISGYIPPVSPGRRTTR